MVGVVAIFGGTGMTGQAVVEHALSKGKDPLLQQLQFCIICLRARKREEKIVFIQPDIPSHQV